MGVKGPIGKTLITGIAFALALVYPPTAKAAQEPLVSLRVTPAILQITLSPATKQRYTIKVDNLLPVPLPINASIEGFDASDEEGGITVTTDPSGPSALTSWIKLSEKEAIIPAKQSHEFALDVTVPPSIPVGGYYALLLFTSFFPPSNAVSPGRIGAKVGVLALANVGVTEDRSNQADIVLFAFGKSLYEKGPITSTLRVKNTSLNYFTAKPTLTIQPLVGSPRFFALEEKTILPGKIRRWEKMYDAEDLYGIVYTAKLAVSLGKGEYVYATTYFLGFPATATLMTILLVGVASYSIIFRKRVSKALHILLRGNPPL